MWIAIAPALTAECPGALDLKTIKPWEREHMSEVLLFFLNYIFDIYFTEMCTYVQWKSPIYSIVVLNSFGIRTDDFLFPRQMRGHWFMFSGQWTR
jgi:hypothetical protein